jgi:hypothetical protein
MRKKHFLFASVLALLCGSSALHAQDFKLTSSGYFKNQGVDIMAFDDIYPEGHQGGVCIIMNGHRVATNGDIRLEALPYEHIRWIENTEIDLENLRGTSDMKKIKDLKGRPLLLFINSWSVGMTLERNEGLVLSEFGRA